MQSPSLITSALNREDNTVLEFRRWLGTNHFGGALQSILTFTYMGLKAWIICLQCLCNICILNPDAIHKLWKIITRSYSAVDVCVTQQSQPPGACRKKQCSRVIPPPYLTPSISPHIACAKTLAITCTLLIQIPQRMVPTPQFSLFMHAHLSFVERLGKCCPGLGG